MRSNRDTIAIENNEKVITLEGKGTTLKVKCENVL